MNGRTSTDWSIQEVARLAGTTSRTLRHYGDLGLLPPSRVAANGYRHYDEDALVRLQRILLLRDLGLGLGDIADVLDTEASAPVALRSHLRSLERERERLGRQIAAVERTITALDEGAGLMEADMFDGFDHTQYEEEVAERWGADAYRSSDAWWRGLGAEGQAEWKARADRLATDWQEAAAAGIDPASTSAQELAARHAAWLGAIPGTPGSELGRPQRGYLEGLAEMYVADERFAANYGGVDGATFVRDALLVYAAGLEQ
ncbi:MerR family transcriptional regulator [Agromyces seonyuensis]|uniref:MerR family transcriptional regulator n=1 Tax=Agromyces seonyuensis TaxID=2662446 RepID=A0A6I4P262_9MICO|nr:MerR family transcriptional regulator [Agromyces seonyuensis]MWB97254.1 MerR family transcriptional regulator [Agromyces seonyuensis]